MDSYEKRKLGLHRLLDRVQQDQDDDPAAGADAQGHAGKPSLARSVSALKSALSCARPGAIYSGDKDLMERAHQRARDALVDAMIEHLPIVLDAVQAQAMAQEQKSASSHVNSSDRQRLFMSFSAPTDCWPMTATQIEKMRVDLINIISRLPGCWAPGAAMNDLWRTLVQQGELSATNKGMVFQAVLEVDDPEAQAVVMEIAQDVCAIRKFILPAGAPTSSLDVDFAGAGQAKSLLQELYRSTSDRPSAPRSEVPR